MRMPETPAPTVRTLILREEGSYALHWQQILQALQLVLHCIRCLGYLTSVRPLFDSFGYAYHSLMIQEWSSPIFRW